MKVRGPLITLAAVAALGAGILLVNIAKETDTAPVAGPPVAEPATPAPATSAPAPEPRPAFPSQADYVGKVPTAAGVITLEITVEGDKAIAYACDGNTVESWLRGPATDGAVNLANKDGTSTLEGRLQGEAVVGTLSIRDKKWEFSAPVAIPPAGLYVYDEGGVRGSWIVDSDGSVTGVLRLSDGSTVPAPGLDTDRTSVIDGRPVTASRVQGGSDV
jgi:hypothetical protein